MKTKEKIGTKLTQQLHEELDLICEAPNCQLVKTLLPPIKSRTICVKMFKNANQIETITFIHPSAGRSKFCYFHDKEERLET